MDASSEKQVHAVCDLSSHRLQDCQFGYNLVALLLIGDFDLVKDWRRWPRPERWRWSRSDPASCHFSTRSTDAPSAVSSLSGIGTRVRMFWMGLV